jgi:hypothetical protein
MISSEVQRTLVKSPPELWAELSDAASLARHLGEFGDVRIVHTEPETTIEWAADSITGTISIKPSGWGTKVTLSVAREAAVVADEEAAAVAASDAPTTQHEVEACLDLGPPDEAESQPEAEAHTQPEAEAHTQPKVQAHTQPEAEAHTQPEAEAERQSEPQGEPVKPPEAQPPATPMVAPEPQKGFFARLFGRRRKPAPVIDEPEAVDAGEPVTEVDAGEPVVAVAAATESTSNPEKTPAPEALAPDAHPPQAPSSEAVEPEALPADLSSELKAAEEAGVKEIAATLTAVLDRLGAAHHRPFSRA